MNFITALAIVLGIVIACGMIVGGLGRAFFVVRESIKPRSSKTPKRRPLSGRHWIAWVHFFSRQEAAFDKMSQEVQSIRIEMALEEMVAPE